MFLKKLSKFYKIVSFRIIQSSNVKEEKLNRSDVDKFSHLILIDTSPTLRSTVLYFHYNHPQIRTTTSMIITNRTHLQIIWYGAYNDTSTHSLILLLRTHGTL
ncbi:unnamed protein product [Rotaria sp. Silwood1]|nr:unnamed protein product [Rotaria sp. Silwood1]CAF3473824.1 unnamed protein product [Rotaria sp. Silwood1]CAF4800634.1 unnamed protein product [Rotaria sp. Silwood1]CAF5023164.1 unnamed protein product [Rotaria sp. Silwood1]